MSSPIDIRTLKDGQVAEIVLGPAPGNIVTRALVSELSAGIARLGDKGGALKAIVLRGQGRHFSFGASVQEHRPAEIREALPEFHRLIGDLLECPVPTIAAVGGLCLGGGCEIALACALIVAEEDARFGLPEIGLGVFAPAASVLLPLRIPAGAANAMLLSGGQVPAPDLHRLGLVNRLAAAGGLGSAVDEMIAHDLLASSASSLRIACRAARGELARSFRERIPAIERLYLEELLQTHDAVEGIEAFLAHRPPQWRNR